MQKWWITPLVSLLTAILSVGGTLFYQYRTSQPKLEGNIVIATFGHLNDMRIVNKPMRTVTLWVYIANSRDIPIGVIDYNLEVQINGLWKRMTALYQRIENFNLNFDKSSPFGSNKTLVFQTDNNFIMHDMTIPITKLTPRGGLISFISPESELIGDIEKLRLTVFDGFGGKHIIEREAKQIHDPNVIIRLAPDVKIVTIK